MRDDVFICVPSIRPALADQAVAALHPLSVVRINGEGFTFSRLINHCIVKCYEAKKEILIVVADRYRPRPSDVERMIKLLDEGYAWVGLGNWGFFGLRLDTIRSVGWLDERFVNGTEDTDYMIRCAEANLAIYESNEIKSERINSSWKGGGPNVFEKKWRREGDTYIRLLPEEEYPYSIGRYRGSEFLSWEKSITIFEDLRRLRFDSSLWKSRARPIFGYAQLWNYFRHLSLYQGRRWWNKGLRWHYK